MGETACVVQRVCMGGRRRGASQNSIILSFSCRYMCPFCLMTQLVPLSSALDMWVDLCRKLFSCYAKPCMHVSTHVVRALQLSQFTCTTTLGYILQIAAIATTYISRQLWVTSSLYIIIKYFMCIVCICLFWQLKLALDVSVAYIFLLDNSTKELVCQVRTRMNGSIILSQPSLYIYAQVFNGNLVKDEIRIPVSHSEFHILPHQECMHPHPHTRGGD